VSQNTATRATVTALLTIPTAKRSARSSVASRAFPTRWPATKKGIWAAVCPRPYLLYQRPSRPCADSGRDGMARVCWVTRAFVVRYIVSPSPLITLPDMVRR
jgi:hypothetical protein